VALLSGLACQARGAALDGPATRPLPFETIPAGDPAPPQETAWVIFGADTVVAEVAATPASREQGLMFRDAVPPGTGMLFVFDEQAIRGFWMDNTYVDLDIAFLDASFHVVDIRELKAMNTDVVDSRAAFTYALEVPAGWLADHGIEVGGTARIEMRSGGTPQLPPTSDNTRARAAMSASSL
jgi:uncharacterized membrane protein (UPF0127 family)